ncbi:hypothetical protein MSG28_011815 [Choristoneura fumiferana]|uniref:Uncharacterized protein n=1 Tax=Choristoneura fumiferana TaxID=7141 RepID=A0ACC0KLP2_CHOFU|nr:hypothetical protein MSG28_011815 [Choristoneura fumiferana]
MAGNGEIWLQWFACCYQPAAQAQRTRRRIDRSMIGAPTNFQHTGHIGARIPKMDDEIILSKGSKKKWLGNTVIEYICRDWKISKR